MDVSSEMHMITNGAQHSKQIEGLGVEEFELASA
jgi:hypothetical protein